MTWVAWRQFRTPALTGVAALGLLAAFLVVTGIQMSSVFNASGIAQCSTSTPTCGFAVEQFRQQFASLVMIAPYFQFLPGLIGVFWGAPVVAREFEHQTHLLAFTQSVTRTRWITTKLALVLGVAGIATVGISQLLAWWYEPLARLDSGRFTPEVFSHEGVVPVAYALFAVALGVAVGSIVKRSVSAMAITLFLYFAVRFPLENWLRPHYLKPLHLTHSAAQGFGTRRGDWNLASQFVDAGGNPIPMQQVASACPPGIDTPHCLSEQGYRVLETYQPADRFWTFQAIETSIFLLLTAALITLAIRRVSGPQRRPRTPLSEARATPYPAESS